MITEHLRERSASKMFIYYLFSFVCAIFIIYLFSCSGWCPAAHRSSCFSLCQWLCPLAFVDSIYFYVLHEIRFNCVVGNFEIYILPFIKFIDMEWELILKKNLPFQYPQRTGGCLVVSDSLRRTPWRRLDNWWTDEAGRRKFPSGHAAGGKAEGRQEGIGR